MCAMCIPWMVQLLVGPVDGSVSQNFAHHNQPLPGWHPTDPLLNSPASEAVNPTSPTNTLCQKPLIQDQHSRKDALTPGDSKQQRFVCFVVLWHEVCKLELDPHSLLIRLNKLACSKSVRSLAFLIVALASTTIELEPKSPTPASTKATRSTEEPSILIPQRESRSLEVGLTNEGMDALQQE